MPDFDTFDSFQKKKDGLETIKLPELKIPSVNAGAPTDDTDFDFMGTLDEMKESVKAKGNGNETGLALDEGLGAELFGGLVSEKFVDVHQQILQKADQLIREKKFSEAIEVLAKLLEEVPDHHQALYLKALCLASKKKKENEAALEILLPLTKARLEGSLKTKVEILRDRIKRAVLMQALIEHLLLLRTNKRAELVDRLGRIIDLIPEEPIYPYMQSGALMMDEKYAQALRVVDAALKAVPERHTDQLRKLRTEIVKREAIAALEPVVRDIRKTEFVRARKRLMALDKSMRKTPLWIVFDSYLKQIVGGGFFSRLFGGSASAKGVVPKGGTAEDIELFYLMISGPDINNAQKHIATGNYKRAAEILLPVVENMTPRFPYVNYLCSVAIYFRLQTSFATGRVPKLEDAIADLEQSQEMAKIGSKDTKIKDVKELTKAVAGALKSLYKVREMKAGMEKEAKPIKKAVDEFNSIMDSAKSGISSVSEYNRVHSRMKRVVADIKALRRKVKNPGNKEVLDKLHEAASRNLKQLDGMKDEMAVAHEAERVKENWDAFGAIANILNNPSSITNSRVLLDIPDKVTTLRGKAVRDRRKMKSSQARDAMDKLIDQLDQVDNMFKRMRNR